MAEAVRDGKLVIPISLRLSNSAKRRKLSRGRKGGVGKILLVA